VHQNCVYEASVIAKSPKRRFGASSGDAWPGLRGEERELDGGVLGGGRALERAGRALPILGTDARGTIHAQKKCVKAPTHKTPFMTTYVTPPGQEIAIRIQTRALEIEVEK